MFLELGSFDERYEDSRFAACHLCFSAAERGWSIQYQPDLKGVALDAGASRPYLMADWHRFHETWRQELASCPVRPSEFDTSSWYALADARRRVKTS